jgi:hypothetical protein
MPDERKIKLKSWIESILTGSITSHSHPGGGGGVELGETSQTAYRGDRGKTAYDHSQTTHAPATAVTLATVKADTEIASAISLKHSNSNDHAPNSDNQDLSNLVVKATNKSLVLDTEIAKIHSPNSDNQDLSGLEPKQTGKSLSANDFTDVLKTKLDGVAAGATNYSHPANHAPSIITQDASNRFTTDTEKSTWNGKGSSNLILGDLAVNAYYGDKGKTAYDHSQTAHAPSNATNGADWNTNVTNKPTIPAAQVKSDWTASGTIAEILNKPTIPAAQVQTDWNAVAGMGVLLNKPTISGSNTGDNAVNSSYSGLASSKQDTLVSATNIKTINGTTILGSGDLTVSASAPDLTLLKLNPALDQLITDGYGCFIPERYEITDQKYLECGIESVFEIG